MKNVFITVIPMMGGKLNPQVYKRTQGVDFDTNMETRFPIIPVIKRYQEDEIETQVITVRFKNDDSDTNLKMFYDEAAELGIKPEQIVDVAVPENQEYDTGVKLFMQVLNAIEEDSDVYACITYGTKVMSLMMAYLLDSLEYIRRNVKVQGVYYGEVQRNEGKEREAFFYEITNLVFLNRTIKDLDDLKLQKPEEFLKKLLKMD